MKNEFWYKIKNISQVDSPALVVYPDRVKSNIEVMKSMIDDISRVRPHIKTNKCSDAAMLLLDAGVTKFKCATIAEAEMLGMVDAPDVVLAYQPQGPKLTRFISLIKTYKKTKYATIVDNIDAANEMSEAFSANDLEVELYIDLNVGMNRTGIKPANALALYLECHTMKGIRMVGLHAYDGHIRNPDLKARKIDCDNAFQEVVKLQEKIKSSGAPDPKIIIGGSPTFPIHAKRSNVDCSPGTFIFWDKGYTDLCPDQEFEPAALVISRVISLPDETKICLDLGHKSIGAENDINRRVYFLNGTNLKPVGQSEEHLVLEAGENHGFKVGDVLYGIPIHICPTVALYERALTVENGSVSGEWKIIARDRKINI